MRMDSGLQHFFIADRIAQHAYALDIDFNHVPGAHEQLRFAP
jgi:hypothetical protein